MDTQWHPQLDHGKDRINLELFRVRVGFTCHRHCLMLQLARPQIIETVANCSLLNETQIHELGILWEEACSFSGEE